MHQHLCGDSYYLIPNITPKTAYKKVTFKEYNSATNLMDLKEIKELLKRGRYLK